MQYMDAARNKPETIFKHSSPLNWYVVFLLMS